MVLWFVYGFPAAFPASFYAKIAAPRHKVQGRAMTTVGARGTPLQVLPLLA